MTFHLLGMSFHPNWLITPSFFRGVETQPPTSRKSPVLHITWFPIWGFTKPRESLRLGLCSAVIRMEQSEHWTCIMFDFPDELNILNITWPKLVPNPKSHSHHLLSIGFLTKSSNISKKNNISKRLGTIFPIFSHIFPICSMGFCSLPLGHHQGRSADGRAVLRSSVREFLVSEAASSFGKRPGFLGKKMGNFPQKIISWEILEVWRMCRDTEIDDWKRMKIVIKIDEDWWLMIDDKDW